MGVKSYYIDISGQKFGRLFVIERVDDYCSKNHKPRVKYKCLCDCGKTLEVLKGSLISGSTSSCGCLRKERLAEKIWTGYEEMSGTTIGIIKAGAKDRNFEYSVSNEFLWNLFIKQNRKCALTGYDIGFVRNCNKNTYQQTASLDRIDSSKGYIEGNVQWVHRDINKLKFDWTLDKFYKLCEDIISYKKST